LNTDGALQLADLRGKVVVLHAFQMLCPACVHHGLPLAFVHENRIVFPVGVDAPGADANDPIPLTMCAYGMQGTPTLLLIDRNGDLRRHVFGAEDDMTVAAAIATLIEIPTRC
jgi:hypothetical protein